MPHVIVKLWPGKTEQQKNRLAERIVKDVVEILEYKEESVSIAMEEISPEDWGEKVFRPEIESNLENLYKKPGYTMLNGTTFVPIGGASRERQNRQICVRPQEEKT